MSKTVMLKTPAGRKNPIRVGVGAGHICVIGYEFEPVQQMFVQAALGQGAIMQGAEAATGNSEDGGLDAGLTARIRDALVDMIELVNEGKGDGLFTKTGLPSVKAVETRVGHNLDKGDVYKIWEEVKPSGDGDDE